MIAKVKKTFKITIGSNADVTEYDIFQQALAMERVINDHNGIFRCHIDEMTDAGVENLNREKWFCTYCGVDFREVDWSDVADDSYCPNCSELID